MDKWIANPPRVFIADYAGDGTSIRAVPFNPDGTATKQAAQSVVFGTGAVQRVSVASNGRIVLSNVNTDLHIWGIPIDASGHESRAAKQLTTGAGEDNPAMSRNGRAITFTSGAQMQQTYYMDLATGRGTHLATALIVPMEACLAPTT